jgi:hypothetical protein
MEGVGDRRLRPNSWTNMNFPIRSISQHYACSLGLVIQATQ